MSLNSRLTCLGNRWWGKASSAETIVATSFLVALLSYVWGRLLFAPRNSKAYVIDGTIVPWSGSGTMFQCNRKGVVLNARREVPLHKEKTSGITKKYLSFGPEKGRYLSKCHVTIQQDFPDAYFVRRRCWILFVTLLRNKSHCLVTIF